MERIERIPFMGELIKKENGNIENTAKSENAYLSIRGYVIDAQKQVSSAVNSAMVNAYWNIGKAIYEMCGENDRAAYGKQVLQYISERLTTEFGRGFSVQGLRNMRQFYLTFQNRSTLCSELSGSHYRLLMRVEDENARNFYAQEAAKSGWSVRQLQRQINTMYYNRFWPAGIKKALQLKFKLQC